MEIEIKRIRKKKIKRDEKESDKRVLCETCAKSISEQEYDLNRGQCDECKAKSFGKRVRSMI